MAEVFSASFDEAAAVAVCATEGIERWDVIDALNSLVAKSMVGAELDTGVNRIAGQTGTQDPDPYAPAFPATGMVRSEALPTFSLPHNVQPADGPTLPHTAGLVSAVTAL
jgi:hypothetical protein